MQTILIYNININNLLKNNFTYNVENVSEFDEFEGEIQTINAILLFPLKESLRTLVSLEFLNGICVLFLSIRADIQCPRHERDPLI